ncbi:MAG TPA: hypothetical protein VH277_04495 [Gemmatimonadaceae bacterium]|nr:hypothetical protein [Gemmatimonadaceae bacterium]
MTAGRGLVLAAASVVLLALRAEGQRPAAGAAIDLTSFRYERPIPRGDGLTTITLDAAARAHSRLDDIRVVDAERRQIPYLLEPADSPLVIELPAVEPLKSADRLTRYRVRLPYAGLPDADLRLQTSDRVFRREITVDATRAAWSHDDPSTAAPDFDAALPGRVASDSLMIAVDDGDNKKLSITSVTLRVPTYRLRFFNDSSATLRLVYGDSTRAAPRYDLALVAAQLRDSAATAVDAAPEHVVQETSRGPRTAFWAVLVLTVVILIGLIARLVRVRAT